MNKNITTPIEANGSLSSTDMAFDLAMQQAMLDMGAEFNIINTDI